MLRYSKHLFILLGLTLLVAGTTGRVQAVPRAQIPEGEAYIVQAGDWLTKIAEKYYGNAQDYTLIIEATNAQAAQDSSFVTITNPDFIEVGQKLWVPLKQEEGIINVGSFSFKPVAMERLGISTVVPAVWPEVESSDPLLANAWRSGPFNSVSFTSTPGNDAQLGVARVLGVNREDLAGEVLGGRLAEEQFGDRTWTIYRRDDGAVASIAAATVEERAIYQINLFAPSPQQETVLNTILENFQIDDPLAIQQLINLEAPANGAALNNPFELRGTTSQYPFRGSLLYRVLDAQGNQVGRAPFEVAGQVGNPATFAVAATYMVNESGSGTVEVAEVSATDGTIIAIDSVAVQLLADPPGYGITIDDPAPYASIRSPVQIRGKTEDKPFEGSLNYRIVDAAGQEISRGTLPATGQVGRVNLYDGFAEFDVTTNGPGRVEVFDLDEENGATFAISTVNVWLTNR